MNWRWKQVGPVTLLDLVHSDKLGNAELLWQELAEKLDEGARSVCVRVTTEPGTIPDSILIALLIRLHKRVVDAGGEFVLANPPELLRSSIEMLGLDQIFQIKQVEPARDVLSVHFQTTKDGPKAEAREVRIFDDGLSFLAPIPEDPRMQIGRTLTLHVERLAPDGVQIDISQAEIIDARESSEGGRRYSLKYR